MLVVLQVGSEDRAALSQLDAHAAALGIPWLRSVCRNETLEIGPLFQGDEVACYECFVAGHKQEEADSWPTDLRVAQWFSLVATEILYITSHIAQPASLMGYQRFSLVDWSATYMNAVKHPGCDRCCPLVGGRRSVEIGHALEQITLPVASYQISKKIHQVHYKTDNIELQRGHKDYVGAPTIAFPPFPDPNEQPATLNLARLGDLLRRVVGLRENPKEHFRRAQRWAPTGGNLGSVQAYLYSRQIPDLDSASYYYNAFEHTLQRLPGSVEKQGADQDQIDLEPGVPPAAEAILIFTGALDRVVHKYGAFACRVIHLDVGVAIAQLQGVAQIHGLAVFVHQRWPDEAVAELLRIDPDHEPITAVVSLYRAELSGTGGRS